MAPLGDLVGITRQTSVFAFQLAEYINPVLPTSGVTMGILGLAGLRWEKWAKWMVPLLAGRGHSNRSEKANIYPSCRPHHGGRGPL